MTNPKLAEDGKFIKFGSDSILHPKFMYMVYYRPLNIPISFILLEGHKHGHGVFKLKNSVHFLKILTRAKEKGSTAMQLNNGFPLLYSLHCDKEQ